MSLIPLNFELKLAQQLTHSFELLAALDKVEMPVAQLVLVAEISALEQPISTTMYLHNSYETSYRLSTSASSIWLRKAETSSLLT